VGHTVCAGYEQTYLNWRLYQYLRSLTSDEIHSPTQSLYTYLTQ
jgi:hypothetical protein